MYEPKPIRMSEFENGAPGLDALMFTADRINRIFFSFRANGCPRPVVFRRAKVMLRPESNKVIYCTDQQLFLQRPKYR